MNSEEFYALTPGSIGLVYYMGRTETPTEDRVRAIVNDISSSRFSAYLATYALSKGQDTMDPATAFSKFRQDAAKDAEELAGSPKRQSMYVQLGQQESLELIRKKEASPDFVKWEDERLMELIKSVR